MIFFQHINKTIIKVALAAAFFCLITTANGFAALPKSIAVLPVNGKGKAEDLKELRVTFFNHIGSKNYRDIELNEVDSKIFLEEQKRGINWRDLTTQELGSLLGVEGLVYVDVLGVDKIYAGVYGSLTVRLNVRLVDAVSGNLIWEKEDKVIKQSGGVPLSPWAAISTAVSSALVLRDSVKIELFDKLCRGIAKAMPEPTSLLKVRPPTIFSVVTNALDSPFKTGEEILVSLKGDEGLEAYFNIGDIKKGIALQEVKPGHYLGKYIVTEGNNWDNQIIDVYLNNPSKRKQTRYQAPYLITVDTNPPGAPLDFRTGMSQSGLKLSWEKPGDDDLKEFVIKKAILGVSEYQEVNKTSLNEYMDADTKFGQKIFYRVFAVDNAGNISKPAEVSRVIVKPGPTDVSGELKEDTVFYSFGSPYIVSEDLKVPKGLSLTIEAGTVIRFQDGVSLIVEGKVKSDGNDASGVTFKGKDYSINLVDTGDAGGIFKYTTFRNGEMFSLSNSVAEFDNCRFDSFNIGIKSVQNSDVKLSNTVFSYNELGIIAEFGGLKLFDTEFTNNAESISLIGDVETYFKNLYMTDNVINITAQKDLLINMVEIKGKESFEVIRSFRGPVKIAEVMPFNKSLDMLKNDSGNDLIGKISDSLLEGSYDEAQKYFTVLKELFADKYEKLKAIDGYILFESGDQTKAKEILLSSDAPYAEHLAESLGLKEGNSEVAKVRFVGVRIPVVGTGQGIGKIAGLKAVKQAVKENVESVTGRLPRKKRFVVKDKILSESGKFSAGAYPVFTNVSGSKFEGLYLVFLKTQDVLAELQDLRIIGNKKRELKVGITACGTEDFVRPMLAKELNTMLFPIAELPSKGCSFGNYKDIIESNGVDILVIIKEGYSASGSRVSKNLKMISADVDMIVYDAKSGLQLHNGEKGLVVYHMNESMGKKSALKKAFDHLGGDVIDKLVEIERKRAPKPTLPTETALAKTDKKPAKADRKTPEQKQVKEKVAEKKVTKAEKKKTPEPEKTVKLSVAGVEPVFANMPEEFIEKPFMTLAIENETDENIRKAELTLNVPGYFPYEVATELESIPARNRVRLQLYAEFSGEVLKLERTRKADADISIKYAGKTTKIKYPVTIFESHNVRWNTGDKAALFIDDEAEVIKAIADQVKSVASGITDDQNLMKFYSGLIAYEYLSGYGMNFKENAKRPFREVYGSMTKVDTVRFPVEMLADKTGDCDELFTLYASVLKAMGIDSSFAVVDGRIMAMFDTSIPEELLESLGLDKSKVVVFDENIWVPMDIQLISSGVSASWESGAKSGAALGDDTKVYVMSEAAKKFKPVKLFRSDLKVVPVSTFDVRYEEIKNILKK